MRIGAIMTLQSFARIVHVVIIISSFKNPVSSLVNMMYESFVEI